MNTVICKEVVIATLRRRGSGKDHSPIRVITEVYEKDGTLIAEHDPAPETFTAMDLVHFARWVKAKEWDADKIGAEVVNKWLDSIDEEKEKR